MSYKLNTSGSLRVNSNMTNTTHTTHSYITTRQEKVKTKMDTVIKAKKILTLVLTSSLRNSNSKKSSEFLRSFLPDYLVELQTKETSYVYDK